MNHGRIADFCFTGLGVVPVALVVGGFPQIAALVFFPLLIAGCCFGMNEQVEEEGERRKAGGTVPPGSKLPPTDAPGLTSRRRGTPG